MRAALRGCLERDVGVGREHGRNRGVATGGSGGMRFGTVGGAGFGTLGAGSVRGTGVAVFRGGGSIWWANISASCRSATSWSSAMGAKGVAGCGCRSAVVSLVAASTAVSADDVLGILYK